MFQVSFLKWSQYVWDEFICNFSQNIPLGFRMKLWCIYRLTSLWCYPFVLRNMMWFIDMTFFTKVLHACGSLLCFLVWFLWLLGISSQLYFLSSYYLQRNYRLLPVYLRIGFLIKFSLLFLQMIGVERLPADHSQHCCNSSTCTHMRMVCIYMGVGVGVCVKG